MLRHDTIYDDIHVINEKNSFATLDLQLPSIFTGGEIKIISDDLESNVNTNQNNDLLYLVYFSVYRNNSKQRMLPIP